MPPSSCVEAVRHAREVCGVPREGDAAYRACLARHTVCRLDKGDDEGATHACTLAGHSLTLHCATTGPQTVYTPLYGGPSRLVSSTSSLAQQSAKSTSGRSSVSGS